MPSSTCSRSPARASRSELRLAGRSSSMERLRDEEAAEFGWPLRHFGTSTGAHVETPAPTILKPTSATFVVV